MCSFRIEALTVFLTKRQSQILWYVWTMTCMNCSMGVFMPYWAHKGNLCYYTFDLQPAQPVRVNRGWLYIYIFYYAVIWPCYVKMLSFTNAHHTMALPAVNYKTHLVAPSDGSLTENIRSVYVEYELLVESCLY